MTVWIRWLFLLCLACCTCVAEANAQALPTAERRLQPSAFALLGGTLTDISGSPFNMTTTNPGYGGRNLTLTAGGDFRFLSLHHFDLALEGRGNYPLGKGRIDGQKSLMGGLRLSREPASTGPASRLRPYLDALVGRGQIEYVSGGYVTPGLLYLRSSSVIYGIGGGFEIDMTQHTSFKADAQVQHWSTPIPSVGSIYPITAGVGLAYRFGAGEGPR